LEKDEVYVIETNLDDVGGETLGYAIEELMNKGALDVCAIPIFCKKNRPGYMVRVTVKRPDVQKFSSLLMKTTGSFGAKAILYQRYKLRRKEFRSSLKVNDETFSIKMKASYDKSGIIRAKPEFSDLHQISQKTGISIENLRAKVVANID
jgi:uncharacterized protein (DUF111 family)